MVALLESRIQEIEASGELDEDSKKSVLDLHRKSISQIDLYKTYETATDKFVEALESAPKQSAVLRKELEALEARALRGLPDSLSLEDLPALEQQLLGEKANQTRLSTRLEELEALLAAKSQRSLQARERLNKAKQRQSEIANELQSAATTDQTPRLVEARRWAQELEARALGAEVEMLNQELLSQPMRIELISAQRDKTILELNRQLHFVELLSPLVTERRLSAAETAKEEADESARQTFGKHELVQEIAGKNSELGDVLNQLAAALEDITREENVAATQAKRVADSFHLARQKLQIAGLSEALGQMLLEQRSNLPDSSDFKVAEQRRQRLVVESSLRQIRNQQERARLRDINVYVDELMVSLSPSWQFLLREEILALAESRRDLLDKAISADESYLQALGDLGFTQRQLSESVTAYNEFLDERLLWIRTGKRPSWQTLVSISEGIGVFVTPQHWLELGRALVSPDSFPWVLLLGFSLFALLIKVAPLLRNSLKKSGRNVGQLRHDRFHNSIRALILTLLLALPWPVLFTALGLHLQFVQAIDVLNPEAGVYQDAVLSGQFVPAIGAAFSGIALYAFYFFAFRIFCEPEGLALAHFGWNSSAVGELRVQTRRLMGVFLPIGFLLITSIIYDPAALAGGLSRLLFVILMGALGWFFGRILAPGGAVLNSFYAANPGNLLTFFRYFWVLLALVLPILLAALAAMGYVYTAAHLGQRLVDTLWLVVAIILIH